MSDKPEEYRSDLQDEDVLALFDFALHVDPLEPFWKQVLSANKKEPLPEDHGEGEG